MSGVSLKGFVSQRPVLNEKTQIMPDIARTATEEDWEVPETNWRGFVALLLGRELRSCKVDPFHSLPYIYIYYI